MRKAQKLLVNLGLVLFGILISFLILEGGVRLFGLAPPARLLPALWEPHPYLGWFHVPNRGGMSYSEYGEFEAPIHINARGLRDHEIGYDNPTDAVRILVLGDSFAEALQVPLDQTFAKVLETQLSTDTDPVVVINSGVGSWGTDQEATFFVIEGFRYQPDLVLLFIFPHNDVLNNYENLELARTHGVVGKPFFHLQDGQLVVPEYPFEAPVTHESDQQPTASLLPAGEWLNKNLALYRLLAPHLRNIPAVQQALGRSGLLGGMAVFMANDPHVPPSYFVYRSDLTDEWEAAWQLTEALILQLDKEVSSRNAQLAVVVIGAPEQIYPERWSAVLARYPEMDEISWDLDAPNRRLATTLESAGIPYLDLLPVFRSATARENSPKLHYVHDGHWTPAGHQLVADSVSSFLRDNGLDASR